MPTSVYQTGMASQSLERLLNSAAFNHQATAAEVMFDLGKAHIPSNHRTVSQLMCLDLLQMCRDAQLWIAA
jgi:hypothetical protein